MKLVPLMYQSEEQTKNIVLSNWSNKLGEVFHVVEYLNNDGSKDYAFFSHLSSALDFIHSNFK